MTCLREGNYFKVGEKVYTRGGRLGTVLSVDDNLRRYLVMFDKSNGDMGWVSEESMQVKVGL